MFTKTIRFLKWLKQEGETWNRRLGDAKALLFDGDSWEIVDEDQLPDNHDDEGRGRRKTFNDYVETNRYEYESRQVRRDVLSGKSEKRILSQAAKNGYVMGDLLEDPGLVDADTETEAVAKVAAENPGWAKMSAATDAYDVDINPETGEIADTDTDTGTGTDAGSDTSMTSVEVDTDTGSVTDAGDLGGNDIGGNDLGGDLGGDSL